MDLQSVRKQFVGKTMNYACSYDPELWFDLDGGTVMAVSGGMRLTMMRRRRETRTEDNRLKVEPPEPIGRVFHVLDSISVAGVDERKHDCPLGTIDHVQESVFFPDRSAVGFIEGRLQVITDDKASIDVTYSGILRFRSSPLAILSANGEKGNDVESDGIEAGAWIVPFFVTSHTRYHWLSEHTCAAFGTWGARPVAKDQEHGGQVVVAKKSRTWKVTTKLDVYSAG
jgi:hypothetical protein